MNKVVLGNAAAARLRALRAADHNPELKLRVSVEGGGCSGFKYSFRLDANATEDDLQVINDGAVLLVDSTSVHYLDGATIDFDDDAMGAQFVVRNPNASSSCGCGSSFTLG